MKMNEYVRWWSHDEHRWIYEHRLVAERKLGRKLRPADEVHHSNENPKDNSPGNLDVTTKSAHCSHHMRGNSYARKHEKCSCGKPHHARGLCRSCYYRIFGNGQHTGNLRPRKFAVPRT